ncbi:M48 family metallopeptidase [Paraglaciecola mesophila]|uniref:M48 family metallopeptidase n=1 Tax=Paraglaciecola mesophila TaxID=197222 RepID=A0ABU9T160_9ALTE
MHSANFYPAGSSRCLLVSLDFTEEHLVISNEDNEVLHTILKRELIVASKLASTNREVSIPDVGQLVIPPSNEIDELIYPSNKLQWAAKLESSYKAIVISLLLVPLSLLLVFKYGIPYTAQQFASIIPDSAVELASIHTLSAMDSSLLNPSRLRKTDQEAFRSQWKVQLKQLRLDTNAYSLQFRYSETLGANAFAFPNGTIVVTDQFMDLIEENQSLLHAVLLHEIGHVEQHHSMRLISQTLFSSLVIDYFFADVSGLIDIFSGVSTTLVQNQFSSQLEWEADNFALQTMKGANMSTEVFALALEKLAQTLPEQSKMDKWLQTHPLLRERIANARK